MPAGQGVPQHSSGGVPGMWQQQQQQQPSATIASLLTASHLQQQQQQQQLAAHQLYAQQQQMHAGLAHLQHQAQHHPQHAGAMPAAALAGAGAASLLQGSADPSLQQEADPASGPTIKLLVAPTLLQTDVRRLRVTRARVGLARTHSQRPVCRRVCECLPRYAAASLTSSPGR